MNPSSTPVLLIAWRRPHTLRQVIDAIRPVAPTRLFVACDGPNPERPDEVNKVAATRAVIESDIDWDCQIERLYSDVNQGCRLGVSRAITWFFEQVEEGIILEDDCVPHPDFFLYCTSLLERYRYDTRVWSICGSNFQEGQKRGTASYYFSIYADPWGWASWRRAWLSFPKARSLWPYVKNEKLLARLFSSSSELNYWTNIFDRLFDQGLPDTWDYQWYLTGYIENAIHAWPNVSLVRNCGYGKDATHTLGNNPFKNENSSLGEIVHPELIIPNPVADQSAYHYRFKPSLLRRLRRRANLGY